jgi:hypothetical protein
MNRFTLKSLSIIAAMAVSCLAAAKSPFISKIYDFCPAPGQFVNTLPKWSAGQTKDDVLASITTKLCCDTADASMICLGSFGGYVTFGFDHTVVNTNDYDFKILGNAFFSADTSAHIVGGSCEPGIVMVSRDVNGNGVPDDEWYELAGSDYNAATTIHNYSITYYKPNENKVKTPSTTDKTLTDTTYVRWADNQGKTGYVYRNAYHTQSYYPGWITSDSITFTGTKLANNAVDTGTNGTHYFILRKLDWGYVDNEPNKSLRGFKIDWAVDANGNSVSLPGIDFVKVYTALNQYCGWIGETSTEVAGAADLHVDASAVTSINEKGNTKPYFDRTADELIIPDGGNFHIFNLQGINVLNGNSSSVSLQNLASGIYIVHSNDTTIKIIK